MSLLLLFKYLPLPIRIFIAKIACWVTEGCVGFIVHFKLASQQAQNFRDHNSKRCLDERDAAVLAEMEPMYEEILTNLNLKE